MYELKTCGYPWRFHSEIVGGNHICMKMMLLKLQSDGQAGRAEVSFSRDEFLAISLIEKRKGLKP